MAHMDQQDRLDYWQVVRDCMNVFHGLIGRAATDHIRQFRRAAGWKNDMVYHEEPYDLASELLDNHVDYATHREDYELIIQRRSRHAR